MWLWSTLDLDYFAELLRIQVTPPLLNVTQWEDESQETPFPHQPVHSTSPIVLSILARHAIRASAHASSTTCLSV